MTLTQIDLLLLNKGPGKICLFLISGFSLTNLLTCRGEWHVFSGNELGALIGWWLLHCFKSKNPDADLGDVYMLASTVSSKLLRSMARKEGFNFLVRVLIHI